MTKPLQNTHFYVLFSIGGSSQNCENKGFQFKVMYKEYILKSYQFYHSLYIVLGMLLVVGLPFLLARVRSPSEKCNFAFNPPPPVRECSFA